VWSHPEESRHENLDEMFLYNLVGLWCKQMRNIIQSLNGCDIDVIIIFSNKYSVLVFSLNSCSI
jgi:hypothetical protein